MNMSEYNECMIIDRMGNWVCSDKSIVPTFYYGFSWIILFVIFMIS